VLITAFHNANIEVAIETNGTILPPKGIDWICVSPKAGSKLLLQKGHELKLVFPQPKAMPPQFKALDFDYFFLQPMDGPKAKENTQLTLEYCLKHPQWRMSVQTHKLLGID